MVKSLATVRSANSPRFMSPPPTVSSIKTSDEKPRVHPAVQHKEITKKSQSRNNKKHFDRLSCQKDIPLHYTVC